MVYSISLPVPSLNTGKIFLVSNPDDEPTYSQISSVQTPWLPGSTIQFEETWEIRTSVVTPKLIQTYEQYGFTKRKLGNWQAANTDNLVTGLPDSEGFLHYTRQRISTISSWTVGIDETSFSYKHGIDEIDNCNYATRGTQIGFGGVSVSADQPIVNESIFTVRKSIQPVRLRDFTVKRRLPRIALYLFPGVILVGADYSVALINLAPIEPDIFVPNACTVFAPDCDAEFTAFRSSNFPADSGYPNNYADGQTGLSEGTHIYSSAGAAAASTNYPAQEYAFSCSNGDTRPYWLANTI